MKTAGPLLLTLLKQFGEVLPRTGMSPARAGEAVPTTYEGLLTLDTRFVMAIVGAWLTGTTGADEETGKRLALWRDLAQEALTAASAALSSSLPRFLVTAEIIIGLVRTAGTACRVAGAGRGRAGAAAARHLPAGPPGGRGR